MFIVDGHGNGAVFQNDFALVPGCPHYFLTERDIYDQPVIGGADFVFLSVQEKVYNGKTQG